MNKEFTNHLTTMIFFKSSLIVSVLLLLSSSAPAQDLSVPKIFSDHMVLQRNDDIRFWGNARPGEEVSITINNMTVSTVTNTDGSWETLFPEQEAGGPYTLKITSGNILTFEDVYIGDVWLAGGQSNMEWEIGANINNMEEELNDSDYPQIRFFKVAHDLAVKPQERLKHPAEWKPANKENARDFSAVAWFFAKRNHLEKNVPVGIIDNNWGGTPAESWTPAQRLTTVNGYQDEAAELLSEDIDWEARFARNDSLNVVKYQRVEDLEDFKKYDAHAIAYDDSEWQDIQIPNTEALHNFVWLRKTFKLEEVSDARLSFGNPGKFTVAFVNGKQVYKKIWSDDPKIIEIDEGILREGKNVIAVRTVEDWNNQTYFGQQGTLWIEYGGEKISLEGTWKFSNTVEPPLPEVIRYEHMPGTLYNAMIHPIAGYTIQGAIWYQGESNVAANQYYNVLFEAMIEEWRDAWNQGSFPFLFVQLANFQQKYDYPTDSGWARLQEAQTQALSLANTAMATTIDIGEADDIHPRNKQDVGKRLWLAAQHEVFGEDIVYSGPQYDGHTIEGNKIRISFNHTGSGLTVKGYDELKGFAIAGADKKFYWAEAEIKGNQVIVWSDEVENPVAVRYAWADNPDAALYNEEGLPAVPFRTDEW